MTGSVSIFLLRRQIILNLKKGNKYFTGLKEKRHDARIVTVQGAQHEIPLPQALFLHSLLYSINCD